MKETIRLILTILAVVLSGLALVLGALAIAGAYRNPEVSNVNQIGLREIFEYDATELYVDAVWHPARGTYDDKDLLSEWQGSLREAMQSELYVKAGAPKKPDSKKYGSGENSYIRFTINNKKYGFSVGQDNKLEVIINGESNFYYTDCCYQVKQIITSLADKAIEDYNAFNAQAD